MANFGSVTNLKNDSIDEKVTTNGNGENTGARVNSTLQDIVDTLTGSPVVSDGTLNPLSVFASAPQGLLADSAVQPGDLEAVAFSGSYNDLVVKATTDGVSITGDGTPGNPFSATFGLGFQGAYDPTITSLYPTSADTIGAVPITAGMYWVISQAGTVGTVSVNAGDGIFALVNNAQDNVDADWEDFPALYGGLPVVSVTGLDTDNTNPQNPIIQIAVDPNTISGDGTPGTPLEVISAPVLTGNLLYVDDVNGNDGTAVSGDLSKPFQTLLAAQTAATIGDTIMVFPGTYTTGALGKNRVNWYFLPGAQASFTSTGWSIPLSGSGQGYSVYGFGEFTSISSLVNLQSIGEYYFEAASMNGVSLLVSNNSNTTIKSRSVTITGGGTITTSVVSIDSLDIDTGTGLSVSTGANVTINGAVTAGTISLNGSFTLNGTITSSSVGAAITANSGTHNINGSVSNSSGTAIQHNGGSLNISGGRVSTATSAAPITKTIAGGRITLRDAYLRGGSGATNSISSSVAVNVDSFNSHVSLPVSANVSVIGDLKLDSTGVASSGQVATILSDGTWNWVSLPGLSVPATNVAVVSVGGNDSTGTVGDLSKPFLTLLAAQTAALAGTTIVVYPGAYTSGSLGKNDVDWYFMSNTQVTFSGDCWTTPSAMSYDVRGYGNFISGSGFLARVTQPISNVTVECRRSQTMNGFTCSALSSSLSVDVSTDWIMSGMNSSSLVSAGTARINIGRNCSIGSASVVPIQINGGGLFFNGNISCGLGPSVLFYFDSGSLTISNSDIVTSSMVGPAIGGPGGGLIRIDNVDINSNISQPFSIVTLSPTLQVVCKNSSVNVPVDATTIQVIGNLQYDLLSFPSLGQVPTVNADGTWSWA